MPILMVDIDGTLANDDHRRWLLPDYDAYHSLQHQDEPHTGVVAVVDALFRQNWQVCVMTGRPERYRTVTAMWLSNHMIPYEWLQMRPNGDFSRNGELKAQWAQEIGLGRVTLAIDDNPFAVEQLRKLGICTLAAADANRFISVEDSSDARGA